MIGDATPTLTVIAGPNGTGKSTLTATLAERTPIPVIDPDTLARRLQPIAPEKAAVQAAREALVQQAAYLASGTSFARETTLAGTSIFRLI